ncbi:MAG: hypothetical protein H6638_03540 [Ardenticatenales bacterium]|nr:hypothetical protein [Ardenticatenales bacterium]
MLSSLLETPNQLLIPNGPPKISAILSNLFPDHPACSRITALLRKVATLNLPSLLQEQSEFFDCSIATYSPFAGFDGSQRDSLAFCYFNLGWRCLTGAEPIGVTTER